MVHFPLNVTEGEGIELSDKYLVGKTYPVFILADSAGKVITRWTGFTNAERFIRFLDKALSDLTTIEERTVRFNNRPYRDDAILLARYSNEIREYKQAVGYFQKAKKLDYNSIIDYNFEIFVNSANAAWNDEMAMAEVYPVADTVLFSPNSGAQNVRKMVQMLTNLARKKEATANLGKYLMGGIKALAGLKDSRSSEARIDFKADYSLYAKHDTTEALAIKQNSLGNNWQNDPERFYKYSKWCLARLIDLDKAEHYVRLASKRASSGEFRASVLQTLAKICDARGNTAEAVGIMQKCLEEAPDDVRYSEYLDGLIDKLER